MICHTAPMKTFRVPRFIGGLVAAFIGVALAGCGASSPATVQPPQNTVAATAAAPSTNTVAATAAAPSPAATGLLAFTAPLVGGGQFDGASMVGKPVVFWFWAPT